MTDSREEYGHIDPWEYYETGDLFAGDYIYEGRREEILDLIMLTDIYLAFEHWADDFRYWDRYQSKIPMSRWEEKSAFSELASIRLGMAPHPQEGQ